MERQVEACDVCGFVWDDVPERDIATRIVDGSRAIGERLGGDAALVLGRPAPTTWSVVEYGAHVRDVLLHVRDRLVIALVEDDATFKPLYRDQRVDLGLYTGDEPGQVADELALAAALFARTFDRIDPAQLDRSCEYAFPVPARRTVRWMAQQVVHEVEHHLGDVDDVLRALAPPSA